MVPVSNVDLASFLFCTDTKLQKRTLMFLTRNKKEQLWNPTVTVTHGRLRATKTEGKWLQPILQWLKRLRNRNESNLDNGRKLK